jgi:hypothetical protein
VVSEAQDTVADENYRLTATSTPIRLSVPLDVRHLVDSECKERRPLDRGRRFVLSLVP